MKGALVIALFLAGLYFIPDLFRKKHYQIVVPVDPDTSTSKSAPSLSEPLSVIERSASGVVNVGPKKTLDQFLKETQRPLLVNLWATWCPPCLEEMPSLESLGRKLSLDPKLPLLVTISVDERLPEIQGLFKTLDYKMTFPILHDPGGKFASTWGTTKFPETYLFGRDGKLIHKWLGPQDWLSHEVLSQLAKLAVIK